jgi:hypothetical protein
MKEMIKKILERWSTEGMRWPFLRDPESKKPSVTLMMFYLTSTVVLLAVVVSSAEMIRKGDLISSTMAPILVWTMAYVFYRMRKLDKFKIDLDDKSIELDGDSGDDKADSDTNGSGQSS